MFYLYHTLIYRLFKWCFSSSPNLVVHYSYIETSVSTLGPEDAAMPLAGEIEEIGSDNTHLLPNAGKSNQKSKKRSHKKVSIVGDALSTRCMQLFASSQKKSVSRKKEPSRAADNESRQQLLITERKRAQIQVTNMSCASCVATIERELGKKPGILVQFSFNFQNIVFTIIHNYNSVMND